MALNFNQYASEGYHFLKEYSKALNLEGRPEQAGRIFASIMYAMRDIIPPEESIQLIAQFPMFLKGVYVNGWSMKKEKPRIKRMADLVELVKKYDYPAADSDFEYNDELVERYIDTTFIFLRKYVSAGELNDIRAGLPKDLKSIIFSNIAI